MGQWIKVFILLIINIIIATTILYFLDFMNVIRYRDIINQITNKKITTPARVENQLLLEEEELNKKWELLTIKALELSNTQIALAQSNLTLETEKTAIQEQREAFLNEQSLVALQKEEENQYDLKIADVATQISSMPPQTAAELLNLQDDLQVVDIFKKMNELAANNGQASTVPFLLTLMEREKAARIQTFILIPAEPN